MAVVDHVEEHVRRVGAVGQIADFVDDEGRRVRVGRERFGETSFPKRRREIVDEFGGGREEGIESVLDGAVGDGDGEVRLASARLAQKDQAAPLGDEVG